MAKPPSSLRVLYALWTTAARAAARERWPRERLEADRDRRLRALVRHAYLRVPFYRALYDRHGVDIDGFRGRADLCKLPVIGKADIQGVGTPQWLARGYLRGPLQSKRTSGSSGQPLEISVTRLEQFVRRSGWRRALRSLGLTRSERFVSISVHHPHPAWKEYVRLGLRWFGFHAPERLYCRLPPDELAQRLAVPKTAVVTGYPRTLICLVRQADPQLLAGVRPRVALLGGDTVSPSFEAEICDVLKTELVHSYASTEFGLMASSCRTTGQLHRYDDLAVTEIVDEHHRPVEAGARGRVLSTGLGSWAMPLIRYDQGDFAVEGLERCPCGAPFPTLLKIEGRRYDQFVLPGGRLYEPWFIVEWIETNLHGKVLHHQIEQISSERIVLRVVLRNRGCTQTRAALEQLLAEQFGTEVDAQVQVVEHIDSGPGEKLRLIHSRVASHYED